MRRIVGFLMFVSLVGSAPTSPRVMAEGPGNGVSCQPPDRIEEDWVLVIDTPDFEGVGPQITTSMSPSADGSTPFFALDLNYREYPSFVAGGVQLQVWSGKTLLRYATSQSAQFNTQGETITWTQRMSLSGGKITYEIASGQSTTWGDFGQDLSTSFDTALGSLSAYSPDTTVTNSGVSWQTNNVKQMTLTTIRYYAGDTLLSTDTTSRPIVVDGVSVVPVAAPTCP